MVKTKLLWLIQTVEELLWKKYETHRVFWGLSCPSKFENEDCTVTVAS